jgi:hypothetical protein
MRGRFKFSRTKAVPWSRGRWSFGGVFSDQGGLTSEQVQDGIGKGHKSIKNHVEGRGGREEPAAG